MGCFKLDTLRIHSVQFDSDNQRLVSRRGFADLFADDTCLFIYGRNLDV